MGAGSGMSSKAELQEIAAESARLFKAPVALIGMLEPNRESIRTSVGWDVAALPRACSFAAIAAEAGGVSIAPDAAADAGLAAHPLVKGQPHIRFIATAPMIDDGRFLGALTVLDTQPHEVTRDQASLLQLLASYAARVLVFEERIDESEERFRDFFDRIPEFVMSINAEGKLLHANAATFDILGYSFEELRKGPITRVIDPDSREAFRRAFGEVFASGYAQTVETIFVTSAGRRIDVEGSLYPKVIDGTPVLLRVMFRDITERKQFEADLGSARDAALEAARLKTHFLTNVSHEIRTPMNGIVGMIDLLLSTPLDPAQRDYAHQARSSAEELLSIVNNILYVSSLEAAGLAPAMFDFDLPRTLQRIVEVRQVGALGKDLEIRMEMDKSIPSIVRGQQGRLRQVITNLMENAIKFTEEGSVVLSVSQQTETETHRVLRFEVRDTGPGISPEDRLLLFERFSQIDASSTRRFSGVGLGLATARQLVETMGGLIDVESTVGLGSTFWFTAPFPRQLGSRRPIASSDLEFRGKRVLLVDHYPTSKQIVRHYLETTWEMRVSEGENAEDVITAMRREAAAGDPFRLVLFDTMRDMDPLSFAREVGARKEIAGTSLVYLATDVREINQERLREAGIHAFIAKPVGQAELFDAITVALAHDAIPLVKLASPQPQEVHPAPREISAEERKSIRVLL